MTAHVGYFLTTIVGFVAACSLINSWIIGIGESLLGKFYANIVGVVVVILLLIVFVGGFFPYSPKYFFARIQYYNVLSEVVWNHMPFSSSHAKDELFDILMARALEPFGPKGLRLGVRNAVSEFFEARLYVSFKSRGLEGEYSLTSHEQELFRLSRYIAEFGGIGTYKGKALRWDKTKLLLLAYKATVDSGLKPYKTIDTQLDEYQIRRKEILELLASALYGTKQSNNKV